MSQGPLCAIWRLFTDRDAKTRLHSENILTHHDASICSLLTGHPVVNCLFAMHATARSIHSKRFSASASSCSMARWARWCSATSFRGSNIAARVSRLDRQRSQGRPRTAPTHPAGSDRGDPHPISQGRRRYHRNQYFQRDHHRPARFPFPGEPENGRKDAEFFQRVVEDPELGALVHEMNIAAARIARSAADRS